MKILVANPATQWPVKKGTDRLILNLLEGLAVDNQVTLVGMANSTADLDGLQNIAKRNISVRAMLAPNRRSVLHRAAYKIRYALSCVFTGIPPRVRYAAPDAYLRLVADTAREQGVDIVLANYWHLYRLPAYLNGPKPVLVTHDLDFLVNPGRLRSIPGAMARFVAMLETRALERIERKAYEAYDTILTVTASDADVLAQHPIAAGKTVRPLPLALDLSVFKPDVFERRENTILFLGALFSDFNRDALRYFSGEVMPLVRARIPDAVLQVVGYGADDEMRREAGENVIFTGGVGDILPYLGTCTLMVLPLRFCGGVRIRLMEAAAMGTPVVSTPIAVAGMLVEPGRDYLEAESAQDMADAVVTVLENRDEASRLGGSLRAWAEKNISMANYPQRLNSLLDELMRRNDSASRRVGTQ